mmetsp:Transcript_66024/g.80807  ORF Transcript_66024/g.80807 Transcript_66024/m.80807 type:complete len:254 (-) Transcript_66024:82-843(-)
MFRSCCCIIITLILISIGIGWNFLMHQRGDSIIVAERYFEINAFYGWDRVTWFYATYNHDEIKISQNVTYIKYNDAYDTYCNAFNDTQSISPPIFCDSLNQVMNAGKIYIGFNILSFLLIASSIILCCLIIFCKCACNCKCPLRWFVAILSIAACIANIIALITFSTQFSSNLTSLLSIIQPSSLVFEWDSPRPGISVFLLVCGIISGIISSIMVFTVDKNRDSAEIVASKAYVNIQNETKEGYGTSTVVTDV